MNRLLRILSAVVVALGTVSLSAAEFFFRDGDRVVMIGDSITEQHLYSNYVEMWVTTRFPKWKLTFRNVGIGGDRSTGGNTRFARDVLIHQPTAMTVDFGMNDGGYRPFDDAGFNTYVGGLQGMADQAKKAGIRTAWCTPQPLDGPEPGPTALTGYNLTLEKYCEGVKATAEKNGGLYVDQFHPYLAVLDKARAAAPTYQRITAGDAVHPGPPGQALMAASILKGLGFPQAVSKLEIDAASEKVVEAVGCRAADVKRDGDGVRFSRLDDALPFFPEEAAAILKWSPILNDLNDYGLKVRGLKPGSYEVRLGDVVVAKHTAEELAAGVNLAAAALAKGPISTQVKAIKAAIEAKNRYYHDRVFRGVVLVNIGTLPDWLGVPLTSAEVEGKRQAALADRMAKLPELDEAIRKTLELKPVPVSIVPAK